MHERVLRPFMRTQQSCKNFSFTEILMSKQLGEYGSTPQWCSGSVCDWSTLGLGFDSWVGRNVCKSCSANIYFGFWVSSIYNMYIFTRKKDICNYITTQRYIQEIQYTMFLFMCNISPCLVLIVVSPKIGLNFIQYYQITV